jgi:3-oxoacyl-[acyl-carrier protein] reductase
MVRCDGSLIMTWISRCQMLRPDTYSFRHLFFYGHASLLIKEGITANAVAPSLIETEMITHDLQVNPNIVPLGRFGTVEEVADVVVTLARNAYITGQTIFVNGGRYMT